MCAKRDQRWITVTGAREHNLQNISISVPKDSLTVVTGLSGSGKSSLALDVLYAEGQRRYMESLSAYVRQFLGMPHKPDVDRIDGLCPAVAIDQKTVTSNPRSTVGTVTEISDYLRVLFARIGTLHCPETGEPIRECSPLEIVQKIEEHWPQQFVTIAAPIVRERKGTHDQLLASLFHKGYTRFMIDGVRYKCRSPEDVAQIQLTKNQTHTIDVLVDAIEVVPQERSRLRESVERVTELAGGLSKVIVGDTSYYFSTKRMSLKTGRSFPELEPRMFSFNSPIGACKTCHGIGRIFDRDERELAICRMCHGKRLNELPLSVTVNGCNIHELGERSVRDVMQFFDHLELDSHQAQIADRLVKEIRHRLAFLNNVGLAYLTLNRDARTLSGGESQRIRLARQLGSGLSGVLYVLDEPSIGLHQRDNKRLINTLQALRDLGNTVLVVEHDDETIRSADYVVDMGPGAGKNGGHIVAHGAPRQIMRNPDSLTGQYLSGKQYISRNQPIREPKSFVTLHHANAHNLQNIEAHFPVDVFCTISGVSGSGKSSLVMHELIPTLRRSIISPQRKLENDKVSGLDPIDNLVVISQAPIGRTPRSNPATYLGIFDDIRSLFAQLPESQARGYKAGRFSFNVRGGRCEKCQGDGVLTVTLHFLPDVTLTCDQCHGARYNEATLEVAYRNHTISDILNMNVEEACNFFMHYTRIYKRLKLMWDVGLGYLKLGQSSTTLSGGEAQRIKLVNELAKRGSRTIYVLDEPTTGLHADDVKRLISVLQRLVDKGNSVYVIEHNLDVLKVADYVIDLGPEGGDQGGRILTQGTPAHVAGCTQSHTGQALKPYI